MKINLILITLITFFSFTALSQDNDDLHQLIPGGNEIGNWTVKDSAEVYSDEDLYLYINGGADLYLEYGFSKVITCKYRNPKASKLHIEIYEMERPEDAYGIYTINSSAIGKEIDLGTEAILYDYYLHFWKYNYYIRCTSSVKDEGVLDTLLVFARHIDERIGNDGKKPEIIKAFGLQQIKVEKVKYVEGQVALGNVFNFSHGAVAGFEQGSAGQFDDKKLFVFRYEDERTRREWFASLKGKMNMSHLFDNYQPVDDGFTVTDRMGNKLSFKPFENYFAVVRGLDWNESQTLFDEIRKNLQD